MNWDNLKEAWDNDASAGKTIAATGVSIRKSVPVVGRIRKKMKHEFVLFCSLYLLLLLMTLFRVKTTPIILLVSTIAFFLLLQTGYFVFRFYRFYTTSSRTDLNTRKNIRHVLYTLEIAVEQFKNFLFFTLPLVGSLLFILFEYPHISGFIQNLIVSGTEAHSNLFVLFILFILIFQALIYFLLKKHLYHTYGRYLKELEKDLGRP